MATSSSPLARHKRETLRIGGINSLNINCGQQVTKQMTFRYQGLQILNIDYIPLM